MDYGYDDEYAVIREALDAIKIDQAFLRSRLILEDHVLNKTDLKVAQDIRSLSGRLIEEIKKAADSGNANSNTDND